MRLLRFFSHSSLLPAGICPPFHPVWWGREKMPRITVDHFHAWSVAGLLLIVLSLVACNDCYYAGKDSDESPAAVILFSSSVVSRDESKKKKRSNIHWISSRSALRENRRKLNPELEATIFQMISLDYSCFCLCFKALCSLHDSAFFFFFFSPIGWEALEDAFTHSITGSKLTRLVNRINLFQRE